MQEFPLETFIMQSLIPGTGPSRRALIAFFTLAQVATAHAAVKLPAVFSDHMLLQCDKPAPVWGTAAPGEKVRVEFSGQTKSVTADASGKWSVILDSLPSGAEPRVMKIRGTNELTLQDVLVGEVWLASGQSNMALSLPGAHNAGQVIPQANDPQLRFFTVTHNTAAEPQGDLAGKWALTTPDNAKTFSAVAYFFAQELRRVRKCPVAVLHSSWGGTPIQTWMSMDAIRQAPALTKIVEQWDKALEAHAKVVANPKLVVDYQSDLKRWQAEVAPVFSAASKQYEAAKTAGKAVGPKPTPSRPEPIHPDPMAIPSPSRRPGTPSVSFNAMIAPLAHYAMRGAIWYQGEADGSSGLQYRTLLPRLIRNWRTLWAQGDFPFLYVQLPGCYSDSGPVAEHGWPWLREAQLMTLAEPHTGMAITIDVGDPANVHPQDKVDVGVRLALSARKVAYGENVVGSGPLYRGFAVEGAGVRVRFAETGSGLTLGKAPWCAPRVQPLPTDRLIGFFVAGDNKQWVEADARIDGTSVIVSSPTVPKPAAVRYGWASSPRCNLYNKEGLPASPFRTDAW